MPDDTPKTAFFHDLSKVVRLSGEALEQLKREARMHIVNDPDTGYQARIFTKPDGCILVDSIGYGPRE